MFSLTPKDTRFYDLFDRTAEATVEAAEVLHEVMEDLSSAEEKTAAINDLEHKADQYAHETLDLLHRSFITPIERGDIRRLILALDDVIDFIHDAATHVSLYEVHKVHGEAVTLSEVLVKAVRMVKQAVAEIRNVSRKNDILQHCIEVHRLENEGDKIHHRALAELFRDGADPLEVLKWKEILDDIESAIGRCEDVADEVEGIVLENA